MDLERERVTFTRLEVEIAFRPSPCQTSGCHELRLASALELQPDHHALVELDTGRGTEGMFTILRTAEGDLALAEGIAEIRTGRVRGLLANLSSAVATYPAGTLVGWASPCGADCAAAATPEPDDEQTAAVLEAINVDWDLFDDLTRDRIRSWIRTHKDRFKTRHNKLSTTATLEHGIQLIPEARPVACPPRRLHPTLEQHVRDTVSKLLQDGHIRPSRSPWAAGVVLTRKKDGTYRFNIDYRRLNDLTVPDAYPMPRVDEALAAMSGSRWFSVFDMASGYWQVAVAEEDKPLTAFVTKEGPFEWNSMPFGLRCAPATHCRLMGKVLAGLNYVDCLVYMDDVVVFSPR